MPSNCVWIEIEPPKADTKEERDRIGKERAERLSAMMARLGAETFPRYPTFWWNAKELRYCYTTDRAGSYTTMSDHGMWFNLDYLGRELEA